MTTALVVDDDEDIRMLYREILQRGGFELVMASSVDEAIALLENLIPDIAFIDMNLPDRPGSDVLRHIHDSPRLSGVKTVVVTANKHPDARVADLGADLFLVKPVGVSDMLKMAKRLTEKTDKTQ